MITIMEQLTTTLRWVIVKDSGASAGFCRGRRKIRGSENALTSTATTENDGASLQGKHEEYFSLPSTAGNKLYWYETRIKTI